MKKSTIQRLLLCVFTCSLLSCNKIKDILFPSFQTELPDLTITIPPTVAGASWSAVDSIAFSLDSVIKGYTENAFSVNDISSVKAKNCSIFLTNASCLEDLSNLESLTANCLSAANPAPAVVFNVAIPDVPADHMNIKISEPVEMKTYFTNGQIHYGFSGKMRRTTTKTLTATVSVTLFVK